MNRRLTTRTGRNTRRGFTLIEMLLVIVIIGILAALLLPAIQAARTTAQNTAVRAEISSLEAAIANFKATYGVEPPSAITLCEKASDWSTEVSSQTYLRRIWPNFDFSADADYNRNGTNGDSFKLTMIGAECLVFFLGGVPSYNNGPDGQPGKAGVDDDGNSSTDDNLEQGWKGTDDTIAFTGFSKDPKYPFKAQATGEVRQGPFFEFVPGRSYVLRVNGSPTYRDSLPGQTNPYFYLSSYEGKGYVGTDGGGIITDIYRIAPAPGGAAHKAKGFQIISPGADGEYGAGGLFDPTKPNGALSNRADYDNVTNLAAGKLVP